MNIKLHAIPVTPLPQFVKTDPPPAAVSTRINCILVSDSLPANQRLTVRLNDTLLQGVQEGTQTVFSWQFMSDADEVCITLLKDGHVMRVWYGQWNKRDMIAHRGSLPVQIIFNGKQQTTSKMLLKAPKLAAATAATASMVAVPDAEMLTTQAKSSSGNSALGAGEVDETGDEQEEGCIDEEDETRDNTPTRSTDDELLAASPHEGTEDRVSESQSEPLSMALTTTASASERRVTAFYANGMSAEQTLQQLKGLVATMPSKTLLIDLRHEAHVQKRYQPQSVLSKTSMRAVFGGKYWDRSWAISTAPASIPPAGHTERAREQRVVINAEQCPDGIPSLVTHLLQGYCLIVMDSYAAYEASVRRAVIEALEQRIPDLAVTTAP